MQRSFYHDASIQSQVNMLQKLFHGKLVKFLRLVILRKWLKTQTVVVILHVGERMLLAHNELQCGPVWLKSKLHVSVSLSRSQGSVDLPLCVSFNWQLLKNALFSLSCCWPRKYLGGGRERETGDLERLAECSGRTIPDSMVSSRCHLLSVWPVNHVQSRRYLSLYHTHVITNISVASWIMTCR